MSNTSRKYPEVGSEDRFDAIVSRGTSLRRRRQLLGATGTGVTAAACVAIIVAVSGSPGTTKQSVTANQPNAPEPTTAPTTAAPTVTPPTTGPRSDEFMTIDRTGRTLTIAINDPATRLVQTQQDTSFRSQQCVTVTMSTAGGTPVAEGHGCRSLESLFDSPAEAEVVVQTSVDLHRTDGVSVGCATIDERMPETITVQPTRAQTDFVVRVPKTIDPGEYMLEVFGVSGFGDGCATEAELDAGSEPSATATTTADDSSQLENSALIRQSITID